jgi:hypothetical protein
VAPFWALNFLTGLEANVSDVRFVPIADIASEMKLEGTLVVTNLSVGSISVKKNGQAALRAWSLAEVASV